MRRERPASFTSISGDSAAGEIPQRTPPSHAMEWKLAVPEGGGRAIDQIQSQGCVETPGGGRVTRLPDRGNPPSRRSEERHPSWDRWGRGPPHGSLEAVDCLHKIGGSPACSFAAETCRQRSPKPSPEIDFRPFSRDPPGRLAGSRERCFPCVVSRRPIRAAGTGSAPRAIGRGETPPSAEARLREL